MNTILVTAILISNPSFKETVTTVNDHLKPQNNLAECIYKKEREGSTAENAARSCLGKDKDESNN